jgi:hypothetical protein
LAPDRTGPFTALQDVKKGMNGWFEDNPKVSAA